MIALLEQLSVTKDKDDICILHGSETVSNDNHGPALSGALKRSLDKFLALRIKGAGRLIQEKDLGVADQGSSNGNALLLPAGERDSAGADVCIVSVRKRDDKVMD